MNVQIRDRSALLSLSITSLRAYLHARDWQNLGQWGQRPATVYAKELDGRTWEIIVPHQDTVGGYAAGMAEAVAVLAVVEERSQLDVFHDLASTSADVIRLSSMNGTAKVPLSLRQSTEFLNDSYNLLAAAARSAERARATHRGPLSANVADFLGHVRPLPGYYEGYELTLHSPVPMGLETQPPLELGDDFYPPFPRLATLKLAEALEHSTAAVTTAMTEGSLAAFDRAVPHGVSANLCDAVAELAREGEGVEISVAWAEVRPQLQHPSPASTFRFTSHSADILDEAARSFRLNEPFLDESVVAQVVQLAREPEAFDGRATILYVREGRPIRMQTEFGEETYNTVISAFKEREPIKLDGDIYRVKNSFELRNPRNLSLVTAQAGHFAEGRSTTT